MISYSLISNPLSLAISTILCSGLILKPIMIASEASAKITSLSVMLPIPLLITFIFIPSTSSFSNEFFTASSLPLTSAFSIIFINYSTATFQLNRSAIEA